MPVSLKRTLHRLLAQGRLNEVAAMAVQRRRVLPTLVALTFDMDLLICWRAIEALGLASSAVSEDDPEFVREQLRRLYWLISEESGGICWRAPESMAEIVYHQPQRFADYLPITVHLLVTLEDEDLERFRAGALWAAGRLAPLAGDEVRSILPAVTAALEDSDAQVRGMAIWCLHRAGAMLEVDAVAGLRRDEGQVNLYQDRHITRVSVGQLVEGLLATPRSPSQS